MTDYSDYISEDIYNGYEEDDECEENCDEEEDDRDPVDKLFETNSRLELENSDLQQEVKELKEKVEYWQIMTTIVKVDLDKMTDKNRSLEVTIQMLRNEVDRLMKQLEG